MWDKFPLFKGASLDHCIFWAPILSLTQSAVPFTALSTVCSYDFFFVPGLSFPLNCELATGKALIFYVHCCVLSVHVLDSTW